MKRKKIEYIKEYYIINKCIKEFVFKVPSNKGLIYDPRNLQKNNNKIQTKDLTKEPSPRL